MVLPEDFGFVEDGDCLGVGRVVLGFSGGESSGFLIFEHVGSHHDVNYFLEFWGFLFILFRPSKKRVFIFHYPLLHINHLIFFLLRRPCLFPYL